MFGPPVPLNFLDEHIGSENFSLLFDLDRCFFPSQTVSFLQPKVFFPAILVSPPRSLDGQCSFKPPKLFSLVLKLFLLNLSQSLSVECRIVLLACNLAPPRLLQFHGSDYRLELLYLVIQTTVNLI